ncbi:unnamed protein product [Lymnaea stagnalis]|uniref:Angiotensin-converting enzyme n=1 Tax=Lymnaea stagnalis TaxID=6523 RepID=A0AAV2IA24_LYMST
MWLPIFVFLMQSGGRSFLELGPSDFNDVSGDLTGGKFLEHFNATATQKAKEVTESYWLTETNLAFANFSYMKLQNARQDEADFIRAMAMIGEKYNKSGMPDHILRQFTRIKSLAISSTSKQKELLDLETSMKKDFWSSKLQMGKSHVPDSYDDLLEAWTHWMDAAGPKAKDSLEKYVPLLSKAYQSQGYSNAIEGWHSAYEMPTVEADIDKILFQVLPLYEQLHGFVRKHLKRIYGANKFPTSGHIPAHLLVNSEADLDGLLTDKWVLLIDKLFPPQINLTQLMTEQNYTVPQMFHLAENFYKSLGLFKMTETFWEKSIFEKPKEAPLFNCQEGAFDFFKKGDFRIKMCSNITEQSFVAAHHLMALVEYYMHYEDQPKPFRQAYPGFQEAFGEFILLSVENPEYWKQIKLLDGHSHNEDSADLNFLLKVALAKVAALPLTYMVDAWRGSVFHGDIKPQDYNDQWWRLRCRFQGVASPVPSLSSDLDPVASYHVVANQENIRQFVSIILQFQFHKAACDAAGHNGPLHKCSIFGSREAGAKIRNMLRLGSTKTRQETLATMTGQHEIDPGPLLEYFKPLLDFLKKANGKDYGWSPQCPDYDQGESLEEEGNITEVNNVTEVNNMTEVNNARQFLDEYNRESLKLKIESSLANWNSKTNITDYNNEVLLKVNLENSRFDKEMAKNASVFNISEMPYDVARQLRAITDIGISAQTNETKIERMGNLKSTMQAIYSKATVCLTKDKCLELEPDLTNLLANSRDYNELLLAWKLWRDETGAKMKDFYVEYVDLLNEALRLAGIRDAKESWLSGYETPTFEEDVAQLFDVVRPLYEQLHAYVRRHLRAKYGKDKFPASGQIPAHLLGDMWAQHWDNILKDVLPFPKKISANISGQMVKQNYNVTRMFQLAESFYVSLGLRNMTEKFWNYSELVKPTDGRAFVCHGSAFNMYAPDDFRIKMCTDITKEDLVTAHHEMGHVQYYMQYEDQPVLFRGGANDGFHEAVGDLMALSVQTPEHLNNIGLLEQVPHDNESDINFLMDMALSKVAFLPFGYLIDMWRWSVFTGETKPADYNKHWWELRCRYQGVSSPVERKPSDFDPGAKFHVPFNVPYLRYFISYVIQFQFHKAACDATGYKGPLHRCDINGSKEAGDKIRNMLHLGSSRPWQDAMEAMTGQRKMDAAPILEYFKPLLEFLKKENGQDYGWDPHCTSHDIWENPDEDKVFNETEVELARKFLEGYNTESLKHRIEGSLADWNSRTNISDYNDAVLLNINLKNSKFAREVSQAAAVFNISSLPYDISRQLESLTSSGTSTQTNTTKIRMSQLRSKMQAIYSEAAVCLSTNNCLELEPGLTDLMANSEDYDQLLSAWKLWRNATGAKMKDSYVEYVALLNESVRLSGKRDVKESWLAGYETPTFEEDVAQLFDVVHPLYEQLHAYVRRHLRVKYGKDKFPASGHIPAHLLGNMWAQDWDNIFKYVVPFPNKTSADITGQMLKQNYTVEKMFHLAESFYVSLGLRNMTEKFWKYSELVKPTDGRAFVCHGTAFNMFAPDDFRIKMCTEITKEDLVTAHHEMGHVQYYMQYEDQPVLFRGGANDGFHEAVGDLMALSVETPEHLYKIGLLDQVPHDNESDINFLMDVALTKVAFLPFGYLIDLWRWSVFTGETKPTDYNKHWWELRCRYQGISSPVERKTSDFDPGAKYHVPFNVPYLRQEILSTIKIMFQFHKAACDAAGYKGPLHRCDIYGSKEAGDKIRKMLQLGSSRPWTVAMETMTGQKKMDAAPLLDYFRPLLEYLRKENGNDYGWDSQCPSLNENTGKISPKTTCNNHGAEINMSVCLKFLIVFLFFFKMIILDIKLY